MAESKKNPQAQINIELPEELAEGTYVNFAIIGHSQSEFILDFIRSIPNMPKAKVKSRVVLSPQQAKRLLRALNDNISKYENQFGVIEESQGNFPPMNFTSPKAKA